MGEPDAKRPRSEIPYLEDDLMEEDEVDYDYEEDPGLLGQVAEDASGSSSAPTKIDAFSYEILSLEDIYLMIQTMVREVHEIIQDVPASTLRTMLNHVNWAKDDLLFRYFEDGEKFLAEAKVQRSGDPAIAKDEPEVEQGLCEICLEELSKEAAYNLSCGHSHCQSCWTQYLTHNIMQEGMGQTISCPSCKIIVEDVDVETLVQDPLVSAKYKMLICFNFVESNKRMRWCPKAGCDHAAACTDLATFGKVVCSCGQNFCFRCSQDWHEPIKCDLLKIWLVKLANDSGNSAWMTKNTKDCPTCSAMIEKNGGCNHMRCRKCNVEFCWNCGQLWATHQGDGYACNRYVAPENSTTTLRSEMQRFSHFCTRYNNHLQSLKLEANLEVTLETIGQKYQADHEMTWNEAQFLKQAFEVLTKCRNTLRYTYAFAFYLKQTHMSEIFDSNQSHLERETEALSMFLERDITSSKFSPAENRTRITDKFNYCEQRRLVLIQHVFDGYNDGTWIFTPNSNSA